MNPNSSSSFLLMFLILGQMQIAPAIQKLEHFNVIRVQPLPKVPFDPSCISITHDVPNQIIRLFTPEESV